MGLRWDILQKHPSWNIRSIRIFDSFFAVYTLIEVKVKYSKCIYLPFTWHDFVGVVSQPAGTLKQTNLIKLCNLKLNL